VVDVVDRYEIVDGIGIVVVQHLEEAPCEDAALYVAL
jgi:hypothetical protein